MLRDLIQGLVQGAAHLLALVADGLETILQPVAAAVVDFVVRFWKWLRP